MNAGIPQCIRENTVKFSYNDITSLERLFTQYPGQIACVMLEAEKETPPADNFLQNIQQLCKQNGAVFILDEMITGFRWHKNGAQKYYNVTPDLSTFGKGLANGFAVSALAGKREIMRLGGLEHETERVFLLSTTHGAESHALAAAMATMTVYNTLPVVEQLWKQGKRLASGMNKAIAEHGLQNHVVVLGKPCCLVYGTRDAEMKPSQPLRTLFIQEIMKRGILASSLVVGYSHTDDDIDRTVEAVDGALGVYKKALEDGVEHYLVGRPVRPVFRRFN